MFNGFYLSVLIHYPLSRKHHPNLIKAAYPAVDWKEATDGIKELETTMLIDPENGSHIPAIGFKQNLNLSKQLLTEIGYDGKPITVHEGNPGTVIQNLLGSAWCDIGLNIVWEYPSGGAGSTAS